MQSLTQRIQLFHNTDYFRYWCSLLVSNLGNWMQTAAMGWLVLQISGSAEALGWVMGLRFLPKLTHGCPRVYHRSIWFPQHRLSVSFEFVFMKTCDTL